MDKFFANLWLVVAIGFGAAGVIMALPDFAPPTVLLGVFQWLHVFFGVLWIGLLYYFNFVQVPAMPTIPAELKPAVSKHIAPKALFYFRWGAAMTVLTGLILAQLYGELHDALMLRENARLIGIGMWLALIMAFNVWAIIWPAQKKVLGLVEADDAAKARAAKAALLAWRTNVLGAVPMVFAVSAIRKARWGRLTCPGVEQLVALQRMAELVVAQPDRGRGCPLVEAVAPERVLEQRALIGIDRRPEIVGRDRRLRCRALTVRLGRRLGWLMVGGRRRRAGGRPGRMERVELDRVDRPFRIFPAIDGALDDVAKLADVARPAVALHLRHRLVGKARPVRPFELGRHPPREMLDEQRDIALAGAQRRQGDHFERQAVEKVGAEPRLLDQSRQMLVGGGDNPDVDRDRLRRADPGDLAIFYGPQQPVLGGRRQARQLVEEQGAGVGFLETPVTSLGRSGKAARLVAKQLRLDQVFRKRRARRSAPCRCRARRSPAPAG